MTLRLTDDEQAYLDHVVGLVPPGPRGLRIVYTPMHGVGGAVTLAGAV